ncbi:hypothetical protein EOA33_28305 [Mesorhizobium sp. M4A.F.Ca.ET.050.02.1.1]|nr:MULTISPECIES: hypothetical protein [unclassified Mesorhizobium]RUX43842.1 hypothetical protein EOA33_28305 [Mesorhizobium sp. M4A.F.Ca.ET.050.02.1.1]RWC11478.1 MAG: hypothetical protein EOS53_27375 [Mesorhizobium sp.]RWD23763.1 MAG: hypothetical protein EOS22_25155 [Mesorhizobium sp.]RWD26024.1 MAG: hypothetical protein EOS33_21635 [Mesorhizobium sp.]TIW26810.1 MAG: hypothetical protein E5V63_12310 [Mesorhizobium sp.]
MGGRVNCLLPPSVDRRDPLAPLCPASHIPTWGDWQLRRRNPRRPSHEQAGWKKPLPNPTYPWRKRIIFTLRLVYKPTGSMLQVSILLVEPCSGAIRALSDLPLKIDLKSLPRRLYGEQFFYG